jgi:DNA-binding CsgD family transcriptional regulator
MPNETELSEREREILRLVATGAGNKEIASKLFISPNTVKVHLRNIFTKINAASRTEATLYAMRNGMIDRVPADLEIPASETQTVPAGWLTHRWRLALAGSLGLVIILIIVIFISLGSTTANAQPTPLPAGIMRWQESTSLPTPLEAAAATTYENAIYLFGGKGKEGPAIGGYRFTNDEGWKKLTDKPTPVSQVQAAVLGELIYIPGGALADGSPSDVLEVYDPRLDHWEKLAKLPAPRSAYALAVVEGRLYLFGGWDGKQFTANVYTYDPLTDTWTERSPMPHACGFAGAGSIGSKVYIIGGYDGVSALASVLIYYPGRDRPGETAWGEGTPLPAARYAMGSTGLADSVYIIGGISNKPDQLLLPLQYLAQEDRWLTFDAPLAPIGANISLAPLGNYLHLFGGTSANVPMDTHLVYQAIFTLNVPVIQKP